MSKTHTTRVPPLVTLMAAALFGSCSLGGCSLMGGEPDGLAAGERVPDTIALQSAYPEPAAATKRPFGWEYLDLRKLPQTLADVTSGKSSSERAREKQDRDKQQARDDFQRAQVLFRSAVEIQGSADGSKLKRAARIYKDAAKQWPKSAVEEDSLFMMGESYFFADRYPKASHAYDQLLKEYPNTRHLDIVDGRRFALARYWLQLHKVKPRWVTTPNMIDRSRPMFDTKGHAIKALDSIRLDDPTGKLADDATMLAANTYFVAGRYRKADEFYTDLRKSFPSSEHQFQAHLLSLKCKLLSYQGPDYDSKPLEEAEELVKQIRRQFASEVGPEADYLDRAARELVAKKAEKEWERARYYERRNQYGAARYVYGRILEEYPSTSLAQQVRQRLDQINDQPDTPPQRMAWLSDWFTVLEDENKTVLTTDGTKVIRR